MKRLMLSIEDDVFEIAEDLLLEEIRAVEAEYQIFQDTWGDYIYEQLFAKYEGLDWSLSELAIESIAGIQKYGFNANWGFSFHHFVMPLSEPRPIPIYYLPPQFSLLADKDRWMKNHEIVLLDHPVWDKMKNELLAINAAYEKAAEFFRSFMAFVGELFQQYPSINEVLAAWPAFRYLLPARYQNEEFPFEGKPYPLPEGHDVAAFTAFLVRSRLMEA